MHRLLPIALAAALAAQVTCTAAETMYKCVAPSGKISYSSRPCDGQAREAKKFAVPAPESDAAGSARLERERDKLRIAEMQFKQRQARNGQARKYVGSASRVQRPAPPDKQAGERAEAARLNKARIGNCTMRRPEANCL